MADLSRFQLTKPTMTVREVKTLDGRIGILQDLVRKGIRNPVIYQLVREIVSRCPDRNDGCEIAQVFWYVKSNVRYTQDIFGIDSYQAPQRTVQFKAGDCLPAGTLVLTDDFQFVPIEHLRAGTRIWGYDKFTPVERVWEKGALSLDAVHLNNGGWLRATRDHKVYVARCAQHEDLNQRVAAGERTKSSSGGGWKGGNAIQPCRCDVAKRKIVRVPLAELRVGDVMLTPERVAFGGDDQDPDLAYLDGLFLADGWADISDSDPGSPHRFSISGKDGFPKERNKHFVRQLMERLGVPTRWHERYIAINDAKMAHRMAMMGRYAPEKRALTIDLGEGAAGALLRGIMEDSGHGTNTRARTFTTTSHRLFLQTRVLHKMFGVSCGASFIEDHGGLGTHAVWRLVPRVRASEHLRGKREKLLRVLAIEHDVDVAPCYDLTTEDHYVYLPEHDVTVSNCDDSSVLLCSMLGSIGYQTGFRVISVNGQVWEHIYALVGVPKPGSSKLIALDATVPSAFPGWQPPMWRAKKDFFPIKYA